MNKNVLITMAGLGALAVVCSGCGDSEKNTADTFDASAYASAYLDYELKGDAETFADLSGLDSKELQAAYDRKIASYADLSQHMDPSSQEAYAFAPELPEKYTEAWKNVFQHVNYQVTDATKEKDSYTVTVETKKMNLYAPAADLTTAMWNDYHQEYGDEDQTDSLNLSLGFQIDAWNQVLESVTFQEGETSTVTLSKDKDKIWRISEKDLQELTDLLLDTPMDAPQTQEEDTSSPSDTSESEGLPETDFPEDLQDAASHSLGETFSLKDGDQPFASFSLDQVSVTTERNEQEASSPEKVIVLTYTYKNEGSEFPILFDDMSFQVLEGDTVCKPYYLTSLTPANIAEAGREAVTGSLAYQVSSSAKEVTVLVRNPEISDFAQITVPLS